MKKPETRKAISLWKIEQAVKDYLDFIDNDKDYHEDGLEKYENAIFEKAVESFVGEKAWDWINNRRE